MYFDSYGVCYALKILQCSYKGKARARGHKFCMCISFKHIPNVSRYHMQESLDDSDHLRERTFEGLSVDVGVVLGVLVFDVSVHLRLGE